MTISSTANRTSTAGDGVVTAFTFPYLFLADDDLTVILVVDSTGVETTQTITTHYTVSGSGVAAGGTVTMVTPPASGETLVIIRTEQFTQGLDLVENDPFPSDLVEQQFDILTMLAQQLDDRIDRSFVLSDGDTTGVSLTLPTPVALELLRWDSGLTALEGVTAGALDALVAEGDNPAALGTAAPGTSAEYSRGDHVHASGLGTTHQAYDADTSKLDVAETRSASLNLADNELIRPKIKDYGETLNAIGSIGGGAQDIDLVSGNTVSGTVDTSTTTFTFSNPPASGTTGSFTLTLTNGGSQTVNWPASVDWPGGTAPTLTTAGKDKFVFTTDDAGTIWDGFTVGLDIK